MAYSIKTNNTTKHSEVFVNDEKVFSIVPYEKNKSWICSDFEGKIILETKELTCMLKDLKSHLEVLS